MNVLLICLIFPLIGLAFDWQGHRGARGLYPENTINGMIEALKYPVNTLELDVVISKDHQVVVSHEPWMSGEICLDKKGRQVEGKRYNFYQLTFKEIESFDCGSKNHPRFPEQKKVVEHRPLLRDLLLKLEQEIQSRSLKINYNIEIKSTLEDEKDGYQPDFKKFSDKVIEEVTKILPLDRFSIQSFDWRVLTYLHASFPRLRLVALRETPYEAQNILTELGFIPYAFSPDWNLLSARDVAIFHQQNLKVIPWTVNSIEAMKKTIAMGVDGMITDYPNLIKEIPVDSYLLVPDCGKRFNRFEGNCVRIPRHAYPSENNPGWVCKSGYFQKRDSCEKINLPAHALFSSDGKTWICKPGFKRYRYKCEKISR